jgi:hypothetical protein
MKMKGPRESVDSIANPDSTPILIGVDITGSMGILATEIVKTGLGVVINGIYDNKPVTDPHVMLAAIGDVTCDQAPLQVTQFEADVSLVKQIEKIYIEGGGGGNNGESYPALWWFAANKTKCDSWDKRGRKGYLFTVGDERPLPKLSKKAINTFLGSGAESDQTIEELLVAVSEKFNVFHLIVPTDATAQQGAIDVWKALLGERAVIVPNHEKLAEVIVALMQVNEGQDLDAVSKTWGAATTALVKGSAPVGSAIEHI